jgi:hypothetical protein
MEVLYLKKWSSIGLSCEEIPLDYLNKVWINAMLCTATVSVRAVARAIATGNSTSACADLSHSLSHGGIHKLG